MDWALSRSSLRDFEEALFCSRPQPQEKDPGPSTGSYNSSGAKPGLSSASYSSRPSVTWMLGERAHPAKDWDSYWERNEPLRDADEVAVPVLCICSRDDPLLPPASTVPLPLFQSNPYFLLVMTDTGGHCGFTLEGTEKGDIRNEEGEDEGNWSHIAVLEYFRVVADFLKGEREGVRWDSARGEYSQGVQRSRTGTMSHPRRRRATMTRRPRTQTQDQVYVEAEDEQFTWRRSYTR